MVHLLWFFALVYVVEGLGQIGGLIAQPLTYYLKQVQGWTPVQITAYLTLFNLPWIIKPLYGLVSDFIPLFGYRRKSYLLIANAAATCGFLLVSRLTVPDQLVFALMLTAYAMAISSTLCGAVLVENGQRLKESGTFINQQWLWYNIAAMTGAIVGGQLVQNLVPTAALHTAAALVSVAPLLVIFGTLFLIDEKKASMNIQGMKHTFEGLSIAFRRRHLWIIAAFIFLYYFSPGLSTPLYFIMTDDLKFSQAYIGVLGSLALFFWNEATAAVISFCAGLAAMIATVATLTLAADYCPRRAEGFAFAVLMSIINLSTALADNLGSYLFTDVFHRRLEPLVILSAAFTAFAFVLVPLLHLGEKRQGDPAVAALAPPPPDTR